MIERKAHITTIALYSLAVAACRAEAPEHSSGAKATRATPALVSPSPAPSARDRALERGSELYARMCSVCHGPRGEGYAADRAPALAHPDFLASVGDEALALAIAEGRKGTTMSAWSVARGGPLSDRDLSALLTYLRSWQRGERALLDERPARGNAEAGHERFAQTCERCHGERGPFVRIQDREWLSTASTGFLRHAIRKGRRGTEMPSFEGLGDEAIEDLVAYLRSLPAWPTPDVLPVASRPPPLPLGPVPMNPRGAHPRGFSAYPAMTSVAVVHEAFALGARMTLIDARVPSDYAQLHITGAVSVPFYDPSPYLAALPRDSWIVCYCGCPHAESGALAEQLVQAGFKRVTVLDEGLGEWLAKGHPVRTGIQP